MTSSKKSNCKGTLRQVFIRIYRLEIPSVMLVIFTQLCELFPLFDGSQETGIKNPPKQLLHGYYSKVTWRIFL
jgi:hypothetical protein